MEIAERYKRNIAALSVEESASLAGKRVAIIGCGGLGGHCIEMLARIGVGCIVAVDPDVFEESNLNRQRFATQGTLGRSKARTAAEAVADINPLVTVEPREVALGEENARELIAGCDCAIDCLDNLMARFWLAHACQEAGIPLVYGAIAGWYGQVSTVFPGDVSFVSLYGAIEGKGIERSEGCLPFTAVCTASFQVAEAVKVLVGREDVLRNQLLMVDMLFGSCEAMPLA